MANKKTNRLVFILVILLSVFSFVFTNVEACQILNNPDVVMEMDTQESDHNQKLLPEVYIVKQLLTKALDILGSNF